MLPIKRKPVALIYNWYLYPRGPHLVGHIIAHPNQCSFKKYTQITSPIIRWDSSNGLVETHNTLYLLRWRWHEIPLPYDLRWLEWLNAQSPRS